MVFKILYIFAKTFF